MDITRSLESFFRDEVDKAFRAEGLEADQLTEHYLVHLLAGYAAQPIEERPLAIRLLESIQASPRERRVTLREIGDSALFISGFWGDSLGGKLIDVDYYIEMGGTAYGELARAGAAGGKEPFAAVFEELAANFSRFVEVLMTISHRTARARNHQNVVRLYERWLHTKSGWAARRLAEEGVLADPRPLARAAGGVH
ncbi:MAG: hypothetical protein H7X95_12185 [Deltaproteobacteria bacterium]|nr:hypothetical protein [Deltaproteobacteria bacterium]